MWTALFDRTMRRFIRHGTLHIVIGDGPERTYGDGAGGPVHLHLADQGLARQLLLTPDMTLGEAYMSGRLTVGDDDLFGLMTILSRNRVAGNETVLMKAVLKSLAPVQRWLTMNPLHRARHNVRHHYDLSAALYDLFLDRDRQYSCAYFSDPGLSLDAAQEAKKAHVARKLCLRKDDRVLDIGCGWGGMALTLARDYGVRVVGVTLSEEQHRLATARVAAAGLSDRVQILLQDYRTVEGPFDRIVSIGMFEHVGAPHFREYFAKIRDLLTPDGVALIHTIGTSSAPRATSPWIRRYIFPGGYLPSMSETLAAIEKSQLVVADVEVLRLHYALTLAHWRTRFEANIDAVRALYDERFCRMWRYYLTAAEVSFRDNTLVNFQFQLSRDKLAVPITRDYLYRPAPA